MKRHRQEFALVVLILVTSAVLRLYRLDQLPPGLHYDEAFNATMAQRVLSGVERPIFFREDLTEEPMAIYITSFSFALFGASPWSLRLVSALAGVLTVAALYFFARASLQSWWMASLAAFILGILYWHLNFSRLGMEPIFVPLTMSLAFAFLWRALYSPRGKPRPEGSAPVSFAPNGVSLQAHLPKTMWGDFALAGVLFAATLYTYKAGFLAPVLVGAFLGIEILIEKGFWPKNSKGLILFALVAVLVFAPLGLYFVAHPGEFLERPGTVALGSTAQVTIVDNLRQVAGMFFVHGDENPRSNLPGRPALDPFLSVGFFAGLIVCVTRIREPGSRFLLLWLVVMSIPSVVTDYAPHFGRNIGVTPAIALIAALGFGSIFEWLQVRLHLARDVLRTVPVALLLLGLGFSAYSTGRDYFGVWGARTGLFESFDVGYLALAQQLASRPANESLYLSPVERDHYTIQFGLSGRQANSFDGRRVLVVPPPGVNAAYGIVTKNDARSLARLQKIFPRGRTVETINDWVGLPYAAIYRTEGAATIDPQKRLSVHIGDIVELIGYDTAREGNTLVLTLYWGSVAETAVDYTIFVHLSGAVNNAAQSSIWAQDDGRPGAGSYPTFRWQAGEVILDEYHLTIPADLPQGTYQVQAGMYNLQTGTRLRVTDASGVPMENDRVNVERITLP